MAFVKVVILLATIWTLGQSIIPDDFYYSVSVLPYYTIKSLDSGWKICPDNSTFIQEKYKDALERARNCYGEFSQSNNSICHNFELNVQRCSQPLVDFYVDCLPEKSKSIPPAIVKTASSVVETFCTSSGEILLEAMNRCIYGFIDQRNKTIKAECTKEFFQSKSEKFESLNELPSLSEICDFGREIGDCWQEYVEQDCQSLKARKLFSRFYNAALSGCSKK